MFQYLLKGILAGIAIKLLANYRQLSVQLLQIEAAKAYLHGVQMVRMSAIGLMRVGLFVALIGVGVLLLHVGLFILLPWSVAAKAVLGMCLGLAYVIIGCVALHAAMSEKNWMEKSGATDMLEDAIGLSKEDRPVG